MSGRKTFVVVTTPTGAIEVWGNLKKVCDVYKWSYNTLQKFGHDFKWDGHRICRVPFNEKSA